MWICNCTEILDEHEIAEQRKAQSSASQGVPSLAAQHAPRHAASTDGWPSIHMCLSQNAALSLVEQEEELLINQLS